MRGTGARGFTLIELVMVIVILGILAAVAIPTFVNLQDDARQSAARGEIGALRAAAAIFYASTAIHATAAYPADKPALTDLLQDALMQLSPPGTYGWSYVAATGRVTPSGWVW